MTGKLETLEGWYTLHDFKRMNWPAWHKLSQSEKSSIRGELQEILNQYEHCDREHQGAFSLFEMVGHKSDFLFLNLRPTMQELAKSEQALQKSRFSEFLEPVYSYVSVVELSNYVHSSEVKSPEAQAMIDARLKPVLPKMQHVCFYPMNKKREVGANWYWEPIDERRRMMREHGMLGRAWAGKVIQMIGGSIGLDDWEWGVTLFADDPLVFKHLVTEMRFDEASARFADFGPFYVGNRLFLESFMSNFID